MKSEGQAFTRPSDDSFLEEQAPLREAVGVTEAAKTFEFLVQKYRREALLHAFALLGNQEDALDAYQDSFAPAIAAIHGCASCPSFIRGFIASCGIGVSI